jgi:hypothetical protein
MNLLHAALRGPGVGTAEESPHFEFLATEALIGGLNVGAMSHVTTNCFRVGLSYVSHPAPSRPGALLQGDARFPLF